MTAANTQLGMTQKAGYSKWMLVLAFIAIYFVWGTTYLAIIFGLKGFPPFLLSTLRFFVAGIILFFWSRGKGHLVPDKQTLLVCAISGTLMLVGGTGLVAWCEKYVSSGQAAIIIATEPFWFLLADKKNWQNYFSNWIVPAGLATGFTGIVCFFLFTRESNQAHSTNQLLMGSAVLLLSAILWVTGSLYGNSRLKKTGYNNTMTTSIQLMAAGGSSALLSACTGEWSRFSLQHIMPEAWGGLFYLIVMGSLVAYLAFTWLISILPPAIVSTHTYVNPVVAVVIGWLFAGEIISFKQVLALLIILTGLLLTNIPSYRLLFKRDADKR